MSSVLEAEASSGSSDSSPVVVVEPPERRRQRGRPVETEEDESEDGDTDELEEQKQGEDDEMDADEPRHRPETRRPSRRLAAELDGLSPPPSIARGDVSSASPSSSRYSLRTRRSKPKRFDESMYNDVFTTSHASYAESTPESVATDSKKRRRRSWRSRGRKRTRRLQSAHGGEDDSDDEKEAEAQYEDELSMKEINRRIKAQEQEEARTRELQRRSTRYSLRSRESLGSMSTMDNVSPPQPGKSVRGTKRLPLDLSAEVDGGEAGHELDEDAGNDSQSENEELNSEGEHDEDEDEDEGEEGPASATRYHLRRRSQKQNGFRMDEHRNENSLAASSSAMATRSRTRNSSAAAFEADEGTTRRYALRDRSKMHRTDGVEEIQVSPESAAYAEFHKRQTNNRAIASRRRGASGTNRRLYPSDMADSSPRHHRERGRGKYLRGRRSRRRRSLSSSSSASSSSSDLFMDDDDSDGGMRTSSPWRSKGGRKGGSSRADITPVEVDRSITWDSVGGLKSHIEALKEMVMLPLLYPEFYDKYNVAPPSGVLFYGPPGTGKTLLARALANSCSIYGEDNQAGSSSGAQKKHEGNPKRHVTFYMRKGADCLSKWVGEAERQLRLLFEEAKRNQPSIIFFDEIDGLAPVRSAKQDQIHASIVSTLLALMDGMDSRGRVVVIGATNRLDAIDPALRRPGRFDRELGFKLPSVNERKSMLAIHSKHWKPPLSDRFLTELAEQTVGYCGADIKALCAEAALCSLRRVYPQVYASENKLLINLDKVVVARGDFVKASKKITPASHRAVSSFASPLPRAVKGLLQGSLTKVLRDVARHFPLFPLDRAAIDDANTTGNDSEEDLGSRDDEDEDEDDLDIYAVATHDDCDVCHGDEGELLCCAACPGAFHRACLAIDPSLSKNAASEAKTDSASSGLWFCPDCLKSNTAAVEKAVQRTQKKRINSIASLHLPRHSGFPRVLISGKPGMGQQYIGPALLHSLEGLTHFSLDYPSLVADSNSHFPEEALIQRLTEAQKCLPCVLFLPQAELWWKNTSDSMHLTLKMMLMNLQVRANLPILFLACTASSSYDEQSFPEDLLALFNEDPSVSLTSIVMELDEPKKTARLAHFEQVFNSFATPPTLTNKKRTKDEKLEVLPLAPLPPAQSEMNLSPEEQQKRKERDMHFLRELRIFLSQVLDYCYSQKPYTPFYVPVDPTAVPNYYLIVKRPMDLSKMRDKLNDEEYTCFEQFMDDIQLIVRNANVFNPKRSRTRHIAHAAGTMKDNILSYAHRFRIRQGYDLFAKCRDVTKRLRANPAVYGEYGQRFVKSKSKNTDKNRSSVTENPGVRTSARLRGVKAPQISLDDTTYSTIASESNNNPTTKVSEEMATKTEATTEVRHTESSETAKDSNHQPVAQWFNDEEEDEEKKSEEDEDSKPSSIEKDDKSSDEDEGIEEGEEVYDEGDRVFVSSRTHPGINREGGAGVVQGRSKDGTYNVKYILGGSEKGVSVKYIKRLTDDAVMESVKIQRSATNNSSSADSAAGSVRLIQDEEKMDETDYFDELLWPILKEEGWSRDDNFDIIEASGKESGLAVQRVVFVPGKQRDGTTVTLNGVIDAMAYITADRELSQKCFGTRYAEDMVTEKILGEHSSDEETIEVEDVSGTDLNTAAEKAVAEKTDQAETNADEPMPQAQEAEEKKEDVQETPDFIYDEARMDAVLQKLVVKTAHWTVDKLRDELLLLNKLAYPFRNRFDREDLMKQIEVHVSTLQ